MNRNNNAYAALESDHEYDDDIYIDEIDRVEVEALVALRIIKHAKEAYPSPVTGALLGMDVDGIMQVTQSFQYLSKSRRHEEEEDNADLDENYQMEMLKCLRQVNADANMVGWYHASPLSHFIHHSWVSIQADFQANIPQSIVLEYDPLASQTGSFCLRAFRLTDAFFNLFKGKPKSSITSSAISVSNLMEEGLLVELPVAIRNYHLVSAMLYKMNITTHNIATPMPGVDRDQYVFKQANYLLESLDDFGQEQARYAGWTRVYQREKARIESIVSRKKHEGAEEAEALLRQLSMKLPNEPPKLDSLLLSNQINQHCKQLEVFLPPTVFAVEMARAAASEKKI